ncbi:MAG TPA: GNAT family N-acetyltransferase, partial [Caldimonas sp.]
MPAETPPVRTDVRRLSSVGEVEIAALATLLVDCVDGGASVGFMQPIDVARATAYWRGVAAAVERGERALLVADAGERGIVGTVQVVVAQPEEQAHRGDISKMLVRRSARRAGIGAALMRAAEALARESGKSLLVLDTAS